MNNVENGRSTRRAVLGGAAVGAAGLTAAYTLRPGDAQAVIPGDYFNVKDYGAVGNGSADDTAAIRSAVTAAEGAGGGTVFFPSGTYKLTGAGGGAISLGDRIRLLGVGAGSSIRSAENPTSDLGLFVVDTGATVVVEALRIVGPDTYGSGGQVIAVQGANGAARIIARDCVFSRLTYAIKVWADSVTAVELYGSEIDGAGLAVSGQALGVLHAGGVGSELVVADCSLHHLGSRTTNPNQAHALYIYQSVSTLISGSRFLAHEDGRYVQFFGGTGNARYALIEGCRFGPMSTHNVAAQTNPTVQTVIDGCVFDVARKAVSLLGDAVISACRFGGDDAGNFCQIEPGSNAALSVLIEDCYFGGSNFDDINLVSTGAVNARVRGCVFESAATYHVHVDVMCTNLSLSVEGCSFLGTSAAGSALNLEGGETVHVVGNRFQNANRAIDTGESSAPTTLYFAENDFSQAGESLRLRTQPTSWQGHNNYGAVGYTTRNGGTVTIADGGTIDHGLGSTATGASITPTRFGLTPRTGKRIVAVTTVSATTLTIELQDNAGAAVTVPESVTWWAEQ
jgi:hypothetical protein